MICGDAYRVFCIVQIPIESAETGMLTETNHRSTRTATNVKTWVFATRIMLKDQGDIILAIFCLKLEPYIIVYLLNHHSDTNSNSR
jgi:hypothetical protein